MKIAILINTFHKYRGMDYVAKEQAIELREKGHVVTIFTFESSLEEENLDVRIIGWPRKNIFNFMYRLIYPIDIYKHRTWSNELKNYDIIIAHFYPMTFLAYVIKKQCPNIKYIFWNNGIGTNKNNPTLRRCYIQIIRYFTSKSIQNADCVISISNYLNNMLKTKTTTKKVIYIKINPHKFDYDFCKIKKNILEINKEGFPLFLYVGVLTYYKGIIQLIQSFKMIINEIPDAKLVLVGKASYGFNLADYLDENISGKVIYLQSVLDSELGFLYDKCDVYVSASTWEGFNLPLVEAQLFGKTVVAFDIGPHKEVVLNNQTGFLVEPFNTDEFAKAMIYAYKQKEKMGANAKRWALKFSVNNKESYSLPKLI